MFVESEETFMASNIGDNDLLIATVEANLRAF